MCILLSVFSWYCLKARPPARFSISSLSPCRIYQALDHDSEIVMPINEQRADVFASAPDDRASDLRMGHFPSEANSCPAVAADKPKQGKLQAVTAV